LQHRASICAHRHVAVTGLADVPHAGVSAIRIRGAVTWRRGWSCAQRIAGRDANECKKTGPSRASALHRAALQTLRACVAVATAAGASCRATGASTAEASHRIAGASTTGVAARRVTPGIGSAASRCTTGASAAATPRASTRLTGAPVTLGGRALRLTARGEHRDHQADRDARAQPRCRGEPTHSRTLASPSARRTGDVLSDNAPGAGFAPDPAPWS
jgi:hypothetical protein